jgi:hypothetical protein
MVFLVRLTNAISRPETHPSSLLSDSALSALLSYRALSPRVPLHMPAGVQAVAVGVLHVEGEEDDAGVSVVFLRFLMRLTNSCGAGTDAASADFV